MRKNKLVFVDWDETRNGHHQGGVLVPEDASDEVIERTVRKKLFDSINHDMINRLVYRGHDQDHPNVLDYANKRAEKIKEIKYQAECPFCHPCTDENADHVTQKLLAILNRNEDKPLYVCRAMGKETGFIMACYENSMGQKKMKLFNIQIFHRGRLDILALQQFITPDYCLKCGRKLNDED